MGWEGRLACRAWSKSCFSRHARKHFKVVSSFFGEDLTYCHRSSPMILAQCSFGVEITSCKASSYISRTTSSDGAVFFSANSSRWRSTAAFSEAWGKKARMYILSAWTNVSGLSLHCRHVRLSMGGRERSRQKEILPYLVAHLPHDR